MFLEVANLYSFLQTPNIGTLHPRNAYYIDLL